MQSSNVSDFCNKNKAQIQNRCCFNQTKNSAELIGFVIVLFYCQLNSFLFLNSLDYSFCEIEELKDAVDVIRNQNKNSTFIKSIVIL